MSKYQPDIFGLTKEQLKSIKDFINDKSNQQEYAIVTDIETLGTERDSVVLSLSSLVFPLNVGNRGLKTILGNNPDRYHINLDIPSQLKLGRTVTTSTLEFWLKNNFDLFKETINRETKNLESIKDYLKWFDTVMELTKAKHYYRGPDFDHVILNSLYKTVGIEIPFDTNKTPRDVRTFIDACLGTSKGYIVNLPKDNTVHDSMGDCLNDSKAMQLAYAIKNKMI